MKIRTSSFNSPCQFAAPRLCARAAAAPRRRMSPASATATVPRGSSPGTTPVAAAASQKVPRRQQSASQQQLQAQQQHVSEHPTKEKQQQQQDLFQLALAAARLASPAPPAVPAVLAGPAVHLGPPRRLSPTSSSSGGGDGCWGTVHEQVELQLRQLDRSLFEPAGPPPPPQPQQLSSAPAAEASAASAARIAAEAAGASVNDTLLQGLAAASSFDDLWGFLGGSARQCRHAAMMGELDVGQQVSGLLAAVQCLWQQQQQEGVQQQQQQQGQRFSPSEASALVNWLTLLLQLDDLNWFRRSNQFSQIEALNDPQAVAALLLQVLPVLLVDPCGDQQVRQAVAIVTAVQQAPGSPLAELQLVSQALPALDDGGTRLMAAAGAGKGGQAPAEGRGKQSKRQRQQRLSEASLGLSLRGLTELLQVFAASAVQPSSGGQQAAAELGLAYTTSPGSDAVAAVPAMLRLLLAAGVKPSSKQFAAAMGAFAFQLAEAPVAVASSQHTAAATAPSTPQQLADCAFMLAAAAVLYPNAAPAARRQLQSAVLLGWQNPQQGATTPAAAQQPAAAVEAGARLQAAVWTAVALAANVPATAGKGSSSQSTQQHQHVLAAVQQLAAIAQSQLASDGGEQAGVAAVQACTVAAALQLLAGSPREAGQQDANSANTAAAAAAVDAATSAARAAAAAAGLALWQQAGQQLPAPAVLPAPTVLEAAAAWHSVLQLLGAAGSQASADATGEQAVRLVGAYAMSLDHTRHLGLQQHTAPAAGRLHEACVELLCSMATASAPRPANQLLAQLLVKEAPIFLDSKSTDGLRSLAQRRGPAAMLRLFAWLYCCDLDAPSSPAAAAVVSKEQGQQSQQRQQSAAEDLFYQRLPEWLCDTVAAAAGKATDEQLLQFISDFHAGWTGPARTPGAEARQQLLHSGITAHTTLGAVLRAVAASLSTRILGHLAAARSILEQPQQSHQELPHAAAIVSLLRAASLPWMWSHMLASDVFGYSFWVAQLAAWTEDAAAPTAAPLLWRFVVRLQQLGLLGEQHVDEEAATGLRSAALRLQLRIAAGQLPLSLAATALHALQSLQVVCQYDDDSAAQFWWWCGRGASSQLPQALMLEVWKAAASCSTTWTNSSALPAALGPAAIALAVSGWPDWRAGSYWDPSLNVMCVAELAQPHPRPGMATRLPALPVVAQLIQGAAASLEAFTPQQLAEAAYGLLLLGHGVGGKAAAASVAKAARLSQAPADSSAGAGGSTLLSNGERGSQAVLALKATAGVRRSLDSLHNRLLLIIQQQAAQVAQALPAHGPPRGPGPTAATAEAEAAGDLASNGPLLLLPAATVVRAMVVLLCCGLCSAAQAGKWLVLLTSGRLLHLSMQELAMALRIMLLHSGQTGDAALSADGAGATGLGGGGSSQQPRVMSSGTQELLLFALQSEVWPVDSKGWQAAEEGLTQPSVLGGDDAAGQLWLQECAAELQARRQFGGSIQMSRNAQQYVRLCAGMLCVLVPSAAAPAAK